MAKIGDHASGDWGDSYVTERTKAMPKNTLFGSVLEKKTQDDFTEMATIDVEERRKDELEKRLPRKRHLPSRLKSRLPGPEVIEHTKEQIKKQQKRTESVAQYIQSANERALYFNKDPSPPRPVMSKNSSQGLWITEKDIIGAKEINDVGLNEYNNFDRDRHRTNPPVHQYALIGDVMRPGMDFSGRGYVSSGSSRRPTRRQPEPADFKYDGYMKRASSQSPPMKCEVAGRELPANIKHAFGTKVCAQLLRDNGKVLDTLNRQQKIRAAPHRQHYYHPIRQMPLVDHPDYRELGNNLRSNVLPGFTFHNPTLAKETYTQSVFENRFNDPDEYRYQRDELGQWSEYESIRKRVQKQWDEYMQSQPKLGANWDRNAKRIKPDPPPAAPKPKPKPKKTKNNTQTQPSQEPAFEPVEFKTPPLTPIPAPAPVPVKENFKPDNDFWDFYDQGVS